MSGRCSLMTEFLSLLCVCMCVSVLELSHLLAAVIALFCRQYDIIKDNDSSNNKEKAKPSSERSTPEHHSGGLLRSKVSTKPAQSRVTVCCTRTSASSKYLTQMSASIETNTRTRKCSRAQYRLRKKTTHTSCGLMLYIYSIVAVTQMDLTNSMEMKQSCTFYSQSHI